MELSKTNEELRQLAMDIVDGKVFTDRALGNGDESLITSVFMPIALGAFSDMTEEELKDGKVAMVYEYLSKAGPTSVNGFPTFFSCRYINRVDLELLVTHLESYSELKKSFHETGNTDRPQEPKSE